VRRVLHLIPILNFGGASRAAIAAAGAVAGEDEAHMITSIRPALPGMAGVAQAGGTEVLDAPPQAELMEAIAAADLVLVHLWNSPELLEMLESDLPPCRLVVWVHVAGHTPPQVLPASIFRRASETVATSHFSARWVQSAQPEHPPVVIPPVGGWERVDGIVRSSLPGFNVGYLGSVAFTRMHPDFVRMSLAADLEEARFVVCGAGSAGARIRRQVRELGASERFEFRGQIREIGTALSDFDVFGYPLRPHTSVSSDLSVKEAMYAGIPPVVLAGTGCDELVADGRTGVIAPSPAEYPRAIERLHADPEERSRLGRNAHSHAADVWTPAKWAPAWKECFGRVLAGPTRAGPMLDGPDPSLPAGTARFLRGLGGLAPEFELSLSGSAAEAAEAAQAIAASDPLIAYEDNGLFDHRRRYPDDPNLAMWTGIFLNGQGRRVLAMAEFAEARRLGCDPSRLASHASLAGAT
jgi:hypothetical protein